MKARRKDETTKTTKIIGITRQIVDGEECVKKNQELIDNIVCEAMAMENKMPSHLQDFTNDLV